MNVDKSGQRGISEITKHIKQKETDRMYEDPRFLVVHPKTQAASCLYGKETCWCTAAANHNQFEWYHSQGKIFILIDKATHAKYQFHLETTSYRDAEDNALTRNSPIFQELSVGLSLYFKTLVDELFARGGENRFRACEFYARWAAFPELEALCRQGMALDADNQSVYILIVGTCYFRQGEVNGQIVWYNQFLHLDLPEVYVNLAGCYFESDLPLRAKECYAKGLALSTDSENIMVCLNGLGSLSAAGGDYVEALGYYYGAYEAAWSSSLRATIVECYREIDKKFCGDCSGKIRHAYHPIRPRDLHAYPFHRKWFECVRKAGLHSNVFFVCGISLYCNWMATPPGQEESDADNQLKFKAYLAKHYYDYKKTMAAMDWCREFLRLGFPEIYLAMGRCCLELELEEKAKECFAKGLLSGNKYQKRRCLEGMGDAFVAQGNYREALRYYIEGVWIDPDGWRNDKIATCAAALSGQQ
jgi:tetratricopeptide (TPR) repeat protein